MLIRSEKLLGELFRHDISGVLNASEASLNPDIEIDTVGVTELEFHGRDIDSLGEVAQGDMADLRESSQLEKFQEFIGVLDATYELLDENHRISTVQNEIDYLRNFSFEEFPEEDSDAGFSTNNVRKISHLAEKVDEFAENTIDSSAYDGVPLQDILDPLQEHAEIEYECDPESQVYADECLSIVANTLLQNTLDHSGSQEPKLYAEVEDDGEAYCVDIWDDGNGIPDHMNEDEIFYRGEGDGSGLGLYLAGEITELFGGTLKYSEENASRKDGFGLQWKLNRPEDQDSGEVMSGDRYCAT